MAEDSTVLADHYEGKKFDSPNDVVIGRDGATYFTDPTPDLQQGEKRLTTMLILASDLLK